MAKPARDDIVSIEAHISYQRDKVRVRLARQWYTLNNVKHPGRVRVWLLTFDVPLLDDDLIKILASAVAYAGDPNKRHLKPPSARFWREVGTEIPVPPGGGEGGEDTPAQMDPLPLEGGFTGADSSSTITTGPGAVGAARPKGARSSAREPQLRDLRSGRYQKVDPA